MAIRPVFLTKFRESPALVVRSVNFTWHPGLSASQKKKSVKSLHEAACRELNTCRMLEISTKSDLITPGPKMFPKSCPKI